MFRNGGILTVELICMVGRLKMLLNGPGNKLSYVREKGAVFFCRVDDSMLRFRDDGRFCGDHHSPNAPNNACLLLKGLCVLVGTVNVSSFPAVVCGFRCEVMNVQGIV